MRGCCLCPLIGRFIFNITVPLNLNRPIRGHGRPILVFVYEKKNVNVDVQMLIMSSNLMTHI